MRVTRYFQSCILIEDGSVRVLVDPSGQEWDRMKDWGKLDAIFYTHEHGDHFDAEMAKTVVEQGIAPVYANASTAKLIKASKTEVSDGQEFDIKGMKIKAAELPHCLMVDGSEGPQNTGYLFNGQLFHPGDGVVLDGLTVENLALPIAGPDISLKDAFDFAIKTKAKKVIPIHYDYLGGNPDFFDSFANKHGIETQGLKIGESAEI
ncbi:MAG TPA: MBL fold metallo-hydrolase [Puia sp.]|nr:MBL fold metallo-hydrolase [Puia sp.]